VRGAQNGMFPSLNAVKAEDHAPVKKAPASVVHKEDKQRALKLKNNLNKDKDKKEEVKTSILGAEIIAKSKETRIKFSNYDEKKCVAIHREMCHGDSLKDKYMINYLGKRYGEEMSKVIVNLLRKHFNMFQQVGPNKYGEYIKKWIESNEYQLRQFVFKMFDVHKVPKKEKIVYVGSNKNYNVVEKDRITQESLFTFMKFFENNAQLPNGDNLEPTQILTLKQIESSIFLEIFKKDFNLVSSALIQKVNDR
jgi:hypothetical protein